MGLPKGPLAAVLRVGFVSFGAFVLYHALGRYGYGWLMVPLAHGPLTNLEMPAMTMAFKVSNAGWLDQMKTGDKIRFMADNVNGALTVVHFEAAK